MINTTYPIVFTRSIQKSNIYNLIKNDKTADTVHKRYPMGQYCTFRINSDLYAICVSQIQEIIPNPKITNIPRAKNYINGVFSLRGNIVTNICMDKLLNRNPISNYEQSIIIKNQNEQISINVNEVLDIIDVDNSAITPVPDIFPENIKKYFEGIIKDRNRVITLLNMNAIDV